MGVRAIFERARRTVHERLAVNALYRTVPDAEWQPVTVRLHTKTSRFGDVPGMDGADYIDISPRLVFLCEELGGDYPVRGAIVSIAPGEAWQVGESDPREDLTVTASVARVPASLAASYPVREN